MTLRDERRLVAVYDTENDARDAVRALEQSGVDVAQIRLADERDHLSAIEGEMRSETVHAVAGPGNVGPFTKEMARGSVLGILIGGIVGFLVALPVAIVGVVDQSVLVGGVLVEAVGIIVGATAGWIIAAAFAARRPDEPLAAEEGTTLAVPLSQQAEQTLAATNARRVDLLDPDGHPVTVVSERDDGEHHLVRDIGRHMRDEQRRG
jgi:hypothetical protein